MGEVRMSEFSGDLLSAIVDRLDVGVVVVDRELRVVYCNRFMERHRSGGATESVGASLADAFPGVPERWVAEQVDAVFRQGAARSSSWAEYPTVFPFSVLSAASPVPEPMRQDCTFVPLRESAQGALAYVGITVVDATARSMGETRLRAAMGALEDLSIRDGLTGVFNRQKFEEILGQETRRAGRHRNPISVLLVDVDGLELLNRQHGHAAGDAILCELANRLDAMLRATDTLARVDGEEFGILLADTPLDGAGIVAGRLRERVCAEPVFFDGVEISFTVSVGVCAHSDVYATGDAVLDGAGRALQRARANDGVAVALPLVSLP